MHTNKDALARRYYKAKPYRKKWWCAQCVGSCKQGENTIIDKCNDNKVEQKWFHDQGKIRSCANKNVCMTDMKYLILEPCSDSLDKKQIFEGYLSNGKFHLRLKQNLGKCMSQKHQPRQKEKLRCVPCEKAEKKKHDSSHWVAGQFNWE